MSAVEEVREGLGTVLGKLAGATGHLNTALLAWDEACAGLAVLQGTNDVEAQQVLAAHGIGGDQLVQTQEMLGRCAEQITSYGSSIGATPAGTAGAAPRSAPSQPNAQARSAAPRPPRPGKTHGRWIDSAGNAVVLESGKDGEYYEVTRARGVALGLTKGIPNAVPAIARHVETQFVSRMIDQGIEHAAIEINRPICGTTPKDQQWMETCQQAATTVPAARVDTDRQGRVEPDRQDLRRARGGGMSITAGWAVIHEDGTYESMNTTLETPDDVAAFVAKVAAADPYADSIRLVHNDRPLFDPAQGFTDHDVFAAVVDGFGYFSHQDRSYGKGFSVGDPDSPGCEFDDEDFPAGSGLSLEEFTAALVEFLRTCERPRNVQWTGW
ncbi:Imm1 family immunity protein [Saccharomonospora sp. NPDC046836]|uniref:Imm1 family immunity protein n=1 Tax=Saccharomonospora sp. NPDC046836 TaxID=3156921 RepID=UPI0033D1FD0D